LYAEILFAIRVLIRVSLWRERAVDGPNKSIAPALKSVGMIEG
jgi:hypothetical protein